MPASKKVFLNALRMGLIEDFIQMGAVVCNPGDGPDLGRHEGVLADDEVCVATASRNFVGRMGSPKAQIFLASPSIAAATALEGKIALAEISVQTSAEMQKARL